MIVVWSEGIEVKKAIEPEIHLAGLDKEVMPSSHVTFDHETFIAPLAAALAKVSALNTMFVVALLTDTEYVCGYG